MIIPDPNAVEGLSKDELVSAIVALASSFKIILPRESLENINASDLRPVIKSRSEVTLRALIRKHKLPHSRAPRGDEFYLKN